MFINNENVLYAHLIESVFKLGASFLNTKSIKNLSGKNTQNKSAIKSYQSILEIESRHFESS